MTGPTTAGVACGLITTPMWLQSVNPYLQFAGLVLGGIWVAVQLYYKVRNESFKKPPKDFS